MTFDTQKTGAIVRSRRRRIPLANARGIRVGQGNTVHFNKQATRLAGLAADSKLKEHHDVRIENARNAQNRLRRLAGQVGLSPENC